MRFVLATMNWLKSYDARGSCSTLRFARRAMRYAELLHPDFIEHGASGRVRHRSSIITEMRAQPSVFGESADFLPACHLRKPVLEFGLR